ncbi:response regulator, partial [Arthrospira platensis SPKY1]|nr:response regulator [Arthrospira platensis SPKY1]
MVGSLTVKNARVLLVEDHRALAETVLDFLQTVGFETDYAADGLSGLHLASREHYDVIILDVMLP